MQLIEPEKPTDLSGTIEFNDMNDNNIIIEEE